MILKGYSIGGYLAVAEDKDEAIRMYINETGYSPYNDHSDPIEQDLDEIFYYFNIEDIDEEDFINIYDRKYPADGIELVSLKRPFAKKYRDVIGNKREIIATYC